MKQQFIVLLLTVMSLLGVSSYLLFKSGSGAPPYITEDLEPPAEDLYTWLRDWERPVGPAKVGLQVGHWKNSELPEELERLRGNTGSKGGGKAEWEVNLSIALKTAEILKVKGIEVDILPSTVPPKYWADVFVAIHADGSTTAETSGFKSSPPRRDYSGNSVILNTYIEKEYATVTAMAKDPNISRNMTGYYAFAWWRYVHSVHPMTAKAILETGFLTSPEDRKIIVGKPEVSAEGLAKGIIEYLVEKDLIQ